jgi:hypothetical protein
MTYNKYMRFRFEVKNIGSFFAWLLLARWVVNEDNEMGFRIAGINFWYRGWTSPHCAKHTWRNAEKREFGETIKSTLATQSEPVFKPCRICGGEIEPDFGFCKRCLQPELPLQVGTITDPIGDTPYDAACRVCGSRTGVYQDRRCQHCGCLP